MRGMVAPLEFSNLLNSCRIQNTFPPQPGGVIALAGVAHEPHIFSLWLIGDTFTYSNLTLSIFYPAPFSLLSSISSLASGTMHWQILHMYRSLLWCRCSISFFLTSTCLYPTHSLSSFPPLSS